MLYLIMYMMLFMIGAGGGFLSGLLGIGGGIIIFPALMYLPGLLGLGSMPVTNIAGLTIVQGFFASLSAALLYKQSRMISAPVVLWLGLPLALSTLLGAVFSARLPENVLLMVFGTLAFVASGLMLKKPGKGGEDESRWSPESFKRPLALIVGLCLGFPLGLVGQGGAFIIIPVMLVVFGLPVKHAAGSMLAIGIMATLLGMAGKAGVGHIRFDHALAMLLGAVPFAWLGWRTAMKARPVRLRQVLAIIIIGATVRIWIDVFSSL